MKSHCIYANQFYDIFQVSFHSYEQENTSVKIEQYKDKFISQNITQNKCALNCHSIKHANQNRYSIVTLPIQTQSRSQRSGSGAESSTERNSLLNHLLPQDHRDQEKKKHFLLVSIKIKVELAHNLVAPGSRKPVNGPSLELKGGRTLIHDYCPSV